MHVKTEAGEGTIFLQPQSFLHSIDWN